VVLERNVNAQIPQARKGGVAHLGAGFCSFYSAEKKISVELSH
jgi:hypothetical protein